MNRPWYRAEFDGEVTAPMVDAASTKLSSVYQLNIDRGIFSGIEQVQRPDSIIRDKTAPIVRQRLYPVEDRGDSKAIIEPGEGFDMYLSPWQWVGHKKVHRAGDDFLIGQVSGTAYFQARPRDISERDEIDVTTGEGHSEPEEEHSKPEEEHSEPEEEHSEPEEEHNEPEEPCLVCKAEEEHSEPEEGHSEPEKPCLVCNIWLHVAISAFLFVLCDISTVLAYAGTMLFACFLERNFARFGRTNFILFLVLATISLTAVTWQIALECHERELWYLLASLVPALLIFFVQGCIRKSLLGLLWVIALVLWCPSCSSEVESTVSEGKTIEDTTSQNDKSISEDALEGARNKLQEFVKRNKDKLSQANQDKKSITLPSQDDKSISEDTLEETRNKLQEFVKRNKDKLSQANQGKKLTTLPNQDDKSISKDTLEETRNKLQEFIKRNKDKLSQANQGKKPITLPNQDDKSISKDTLEEARNKLQEFVKQNKDKLSQALEKLQEFVMRNKENFFQANQGKKPITLSSTFFGLNTAELQPEALPWLESVAEELGKHPDATVTIYGFADQRGEETQEGRMRNDQLSQIRADAVADWLVTNKGVDPKRLRVLGMGARNPIYSNPQSEEEYAANRRVEIQMDVPK